MEPQEIMDSNASESPRRPHPAKYRWFNTTKVTKIPLITVLRRELDYGHYHRRRDIEFYSVVRLYILTFKSSSGIRGPDLLHWRYRLHQDGLLEMASRFLEEEQRGSYYWPDDPNSPNYGRLQYSKDSKKIKRTLIQLVFRINQQYKWKGPRTEPDPDHEINPDANGLGCQEYNGVHENSTNPQSHQPTTDHQQSAGDFQPEDPAGPSFPTELDVDTPIDTDGLESLDPPLMNDWNEARTSTLEAPYTAHSFQPQFTDGSKGHREEPRTTRTNPNMAPVPRMDDIYDVPYSPELPLTPEPPQSRATGKRPADLALGEESVLGKRARTQASQEDAPNEVDAHLPENTTSDPTAVQRESRRTSNRPHVPTSRPDFVQGDEYSQNSALLSSSNASTTSTSTEDHSEAETSHEEPDSRPAQRAQTEPLQRALNTSKDNANPSTLHSHCKNMPAPPAPKSGAGSPATPAPQHKPLEERQELTKQKPRSLPKINIIYSVNVSQTRNTQWTPKGTFQEKPLEALVEELPLSDTYEGLEFVLETPDKTFAATIYLGDEEGFEAMKERFRDKMMIARRTRAGSSKVLHFEIAITPVGREDCGEDDYDDDLVF